MLFRRSDDARVSFAELFFDLVFVFAITQVSHYLLYHYGPLGAVQSGLLFTAIWWNWIYATWALNRLDPETTAVRALLFVLMGLGLYVSMALPEAFAERGLVFGLCYPASNILRTLFILIAGRDNAQLVRTYRRILIWFLFSAPFWIGGGLAPPEARLALWGMALAIDVIGPALGFAVPGLGHDRSSNWPVLGGHIAERCALFVIICLGETLLVSGATFADLPWTGAGHLAFLASVATSIGMWWVYFNIGHRRGAHQIEHSDDPGRIARQGYTYAHLPLVAGIVLSAVGGERAIAHPLDPATLVEATSLIGGPALFLAGSLWFKRLSADTLPLSHLVGLALCAGTVALGGVLTLAQMSALAAVTLALVALWEHLSLRAPQA